MIDLVGFATPWALYALILILHLALPARRVRGYVRDPQTGAPLEYRLNGLPVTLVLVTLWALACDRGLLAWDFLWVHRWGSLAGACTIGLVFSAAVVAFAPPRRGLLVDFYLGRRENPRLLGGRLDLKMHLYLVGAATLQLHVLSFVGHHLLAHPGAPAPGVLLHAALLSYFLVDYLFFERVHLYTYDLFAERVGFKLGWGCLTFYPYFYAVGLWATVDGPDPQAPTSVLVLAALVFFVGWSLARGANLQKFFFKLDPTYRFLGIAPRVVSDGQRTLLCSGFWGVSRHVNYLGELLMASGLALALAWQGSWAPWLYPLYYVALLLPRERDDHRRCAAKYGALWDRYCARVRWRIVPGIY
ncbi:MAG: DUF1295 domain-containing protein [Nannocystaceae bacterium]|nr:DUF1295 domain-containing protein [Myxococcales bacterium]